MKHFFIYVIAIFNFIPAYSQYRELVLPQKALIIGIDRYSAPPGYKSASNERALFSDLEGCENDARSIYSIINSKFNFLPENIDTLFNENATRDNILAAMDKLYKESEKGEVAFIYYAGHGSQVRNKKSKEADGKDESIVPGDTYKEGVKDIRDKELAAIYNKFLDKGIKLTVIMDCCHSGSLSRGPGSPTAKFRFMPDANYTVEDDSQPVFPESRLDRSFLLMSASQDNEFAQEQVDEFGNPHGAFTIGLLSAINQQSVDASALNLFSSIRAILKSNGKKQEPVLTATIARQQQTLFGIQSGLLADKSLVAISGIRNGKVELQGGYALSLYKENELVKFKGKDTLVKVRIDTVLSINKSLASVVQGNIADLAAGNLLEVTNWVSSGAPLLRIYIPSSSFSNDEVNKLVTVAREIKKSAGKGWTNDLEKTDPYLSVYFEKDKCFAKVDTQAAKPVKILTAQNILKLWPRDSTLYFELPPSATVGNDIIKRLKPIKNLSIVNTPDEADYVLFGMINSEGTLVYGLRRAQTSARDSLENMPLQTKCFSMVDPGFADSIYDRAMKLSKIRGWLQLVAPLKGNSIFPFNIMLFNEDQKKFLDKPVVTLEDNMSFHLVATSDIYKYTGAPKYVYVFVISKDGTMLPAYPPEYDGNQSNRFPSYGEDNKAIKDISLFDYSISEPVGTDTYFVLATDEQIPNYAVIFKQDGVRGIIRDKSNPLSDLLNLGNEGGQEVLQNRHPTGTC